MMDAARLHLLEAMGIDVYVLRPRAPSLAAGTAHDTNLVPAHGSSRLTVVCAQGVRDDARLVRLIKHLPQTFGISSGAIDWIEANAKGEVAGATDAQVYLVLGAAMARALGAQLSTMQQSTTTIAVTADPALLPGAAADKRALWQALKPLARRLREAG